MCVDACLKMSSPEAVKASIRFVEDYNVDRQGV